MSAKLIASMCPIEQLLVLIGGRWKPVILWWLFESSKPLRFKTLRHNMPRISQKVFTQLLRQNLLRDARHVVAKGLEAKRLTGFEKPPEDDGLPTAADQHEQLLYGAHAGN